MNNIHSPNRRDLIAAAVAAGTAALLPSALRAQTQWPTKSVRFLVPFAPGGTSEIVARSVAAELTKQLGQSVYVENKPGGAGVVAMAEAKQAQPDGHTIILGHVGTLAVNPYMLANQPYDVNKDFIPVTLLAKVPNVFVIHPDVPAKNFKEFVAYVKANPGKLSYGSAGNASAELANSTADMRNSIDNAVDRIEERAARVRDAAGNSARDMDKAVHGR